MVAELANFERKSKRLWLAIGAIGLSTSWNAFVGDTGQDKLNESMVIGACDPIGDDGSKFAVAGDK